MEELCGKFELQIETVKEVVSTIKIGIKFSLATLRFLFGLHSEFYRVIVIIN